MNEMFANGASTNIVTDSARFLVVRQDADVHLDDHTVETNFRLALPIGNRGLLNLDTPEDDLTPVEDPLVSLCHKPYGLWLALSFDDPSPNGEFPIRQRPVPPSPNRVRKSGLKAPEPSTSTMALRRDRRGGAGGRGAGEKAAGGARQGGRGGAAEGGATRDGGTSTGRNQKHLVHRDSNRALCLSIPSDIDKSSTHPLADFYVIHCVIHLGCDARRAAQVRYRHLQRFVVELSCADSLAKYGLCLPLTTPVSSYSKMKPDVW